MAQKTETNTTQELAGTINSHVQFETSEGIQVIISPQLPNRRCAHCSTVDCQGKHPKATENGCPNYRHR